MIKFLALALGSLAGGFGRYYLAGMISHNSGNSFPFGTLSVNLLGCFLIGLFSALSDRKMLVNPEVLLFLTVGFCGAFTTFSTFMLETSNLMKQGESLRAFLYLFLSVTAGFFIFRLGTFTSKAF